MIISVYVYCKRVPRKLAVDELQKKQINRTKILKKSFVIVLVYSNPWVT
jgi:hypothetical protein